MRNETPAERLGRLIRARRKVLKLTQADVQELDGPSTATLRLIEGGKHTDFRGGTGASLEQALQWQPGSIDRVLEGGDPEPIGSAPVDRVQDSPPDPAQSDAYPTVALNLSKASWRAVNELAESPKGDPHRRDKADRAVLTTADLITDVLLALNVGPTAKPLIQEMTHRAYEVLHLQREEANELETSPEPSTPPEGDENQEDLVPPDDVEGWSSDWTTDPGDPGADDSGVDGTEDGEQGQQL